MHELAVSDTPMFRVFHGARVRWCSEKDAQTDVNFRGFVMLHPFSLHPQIELFGTMCLLQKI